MSRWLLSSALLAACNLDPADPTGPSTTAPLCEEPVSKPHDESLPEWSYHEEDGPDAWGALEGYEMCGTGQQQTPIDLVTTAVESVPLSEMPLSMANYDQSVDLVLLNNGHTLQVVVASEMGQADPQVTFEDKTYYLVQFHYHTTSEHTLDGASSLFELHFVHKAADESLLVVGVMFDEGEADPVIDELLAHDPGHELQTTCQETVALSELMPTGTGFFHYPGSLTTPGCSEGVQWFVIDEPATASAEQAQIWQERFEGTTNRPVQPLNDRVVYYLDPEG
jgi:carbonic anhydrase